MRRRGAGRGETTMEGLESEMDRGWGVLGRIQRRCRRREQPATRWRMLPKSVESSNSSNERPTKQGLVRLCALSDMVLTQNIKTFD